MAEVYEMMMKLGLNNAALTGLLSVTERLTRIHRLTEDINTGFSRWGIAIGGVALALGGAGLLGGMEKLIKKAAEFQDAMIKVQRTGGGFDLKELQERAFEISKTIPMNVKDLVNIPSTLYSIVGKEEAERLWEPMARYSWLQQNDKKFQGEPDEPMKKIVRAGEMTGRFTDSKGNFDPQKAKEFLDLVAKVKAATHGMVNEATILAFGQQAGPTARGLTNEGFMTEMIMAQNMGGHRAGTALMSVYQQVAAGQMRKRTAVGMEALGLLNKDEWSTDLGGGVVLKPEASKRLTNLVGKDPMDLATTIYNRLDEMGITDPVERQRMITNMTGRQTGQRMMGEMVANRAQMLAERGRMSGGMGVDDAVELLKKQSITSNMKAFHNAWENLLTSLGGPQSENMIKVLQQLTGMMNSMASSTRGMDPKTIENIGIGIAALGAGLVGAGATALLVALGPAGWLVGGIAALTAVFANDEKAIHGMHQMNDALASLSKSEWEKVSHGFTQIRDAISGFIDWIGSFNPFGKSVPKAAAQGGWSDWSGTDRPGAMSPIPFKKSSYLSDDGLNKANIIPANFNPSSNKQVRFEHTTDLKIDGRSFAQAVSEVIENYYEHPTGSPSPDGLGYFRPQGQFSST